jgi:CHAT domain-containing protein
LIGDTSTALLEYTIAESNTYLFVLTADRSSGRSAEINLKVYPLEIKPDELAAKVSHLRQLITSRADGFHEVAQELYDVLVKPAEDQITLKTKLVIVPDGLLWGLPFEALQPAEDHYVLDQMQVSYAPSLAALREMRRHPVKRPNSLLIAYGNPNLSKEFSTRFQLAYNGAKAESAPDQEEEIKSLATSYGTTVSRVNVGTQASEERVRPDLLRAKIMHFATPAILDDTSPMSSFIGLASGSAEADGFLQARELMNLRSTAELVVASRAQHNADLNGAAPVGFSWAWFVAGTPATMATRWSIDPSALSIILNGFYSSVRPTRRAPISKARALHQSLLSLRKSIDYEHPYYWAGFAMIGDAR